MEKLIAVLLGLLLPAGVLTVSATAKHSGGVTLDVVGNSAAGPRRWSGVIDGGTGAFADLHGGYEARILANGTLRISVPRP